LGLIFTNAVGGALRRITGHLRRGGVTLRSRQKPTPQLTEQAKRLYADGYFPRSHR
jgi:hypothetical protein